MSKFELISRQDVIDTLLDWAEHSITAEEEWHLRQVIGDIRSMPAAGGRQHGKWRYLLAVGEYQCSACGKMALYEVNEETGERVSMLTDYCPHCGADMRIEG